MAQPSHATEHSVVPPLSCIYFLKVGSEVTMLHITSCEVWREGNRLLYYILSGYLGNTETSTYGNFPPRFKGAIGGCDQGAMPLFHIRGGRSDAGV